MKKSIYLLTIALFLVCSLKAQTPTTPSESQVVKHTISRVMEKKIDGKNWELTLTNDEVTDLKLNGKKLPKASWSKHQAEIDNLRSTAYEMDPVLPNNSENPDSTMIKVEDVQVTGNGDLSPEEKATHKVIEDELMNDKLITNRTYNLVLTESTMTVNGKAVSKEIMDKYIIIYYTHSGEQRCEGCKFKIQLNKKAN
jgi:hypothetical protein